MEHLLAASDGDLPDLDPSIGDDEETPAGLTLFEEGLAGAEAPHRTAPG
jgi:hypothetical protein